MRGWRKLNGGVGAGWSNGCCAGYLLTVTGGIYLSYMGKYRRNLTYSRFLYSHLGNILAVWCLDVRNGRQVLLLYCVLVATVNKDEALDRFHM